MPYLYLLPPEVLCHHQSHCFQELLLNLLLTEILDDWVVRRLSHQSLHLRDGVEFVLEARKFAFWVRGKLLLNIARKVEFSVDIRNCLHFLHGGQHLRLRKLLEVVVSILKGNHCQDLLAATLSHTDHQVVDDALKGQILDNSFVSRDLAQALVVRLCYSFFLQFGIHGVKQFEINLL